MFGRWVDSLIQMRSEAIPPKCVERFLGERRVAAKRFATATLVLIFGVAESLAQSPHTASEFPGSYSGIFLGTMNRVGLRSGWSAIPDTSGSKSSELALLTSVFLPVAGDITESSTFGVGLEIPYSRTKLSQKNEQHVSRAGINELTLLTKFGFTIYEELEHRSLKAKVDIIGKIKFPIDGNESERPEGMTVPHQAGSSATNFALGFAFHTETEKYFMIHGHALHWINTASHQNRTGNQFDYGLAFLLAILPIDAGPLGTFLPSVGVSGMHAAMGRMNGTVIENSGGEVAMLTLGTQSLWNYIATIGTFVMFDASYHLPILQRLNGIQRGYGSAFNIGLRVYVK